MSSSLNKDQPTEQQLWTARRYRQLLDALLSPERRDVIAQDAASRVGIQELLDAGLAVARVDGGNQTQRVRLTGSGLAAALRILDDQR